MYSLMLVKEKPMTVIDRLILVIDENQCYLIDRFPSIIDDIDNRLKINNHENLLNWLSIDCQYQLIND